MFKLQKKPTNLSNLSFKNHEGKMQVKKTVPPFIRSAFFG